MIFALAGWTRRGAIRSFKRMSAISFGEARFRAGVLPRAVERAVASVGVELQSEPASPELLTSVKMPGDPELASPFPKCSLWVGERILSTYVGSFDASQGAGGFRGAALVDLIGLRLAPRFSGTQRVRIADEVHETRLAEVVIYRIDRGEIIEADPTQACRGEMCLSVIMHADWLLSRIRPDLVARFSPLASLLGGHTRLIRIPHFGSRLVSSLVEIDSLSTSREDIAELHFESAVIGAVASAVDAASTQTSRPCGNSLATFCDRLSQVRKILTENWREPINISQLCDVAKMNRTQLRARFKNMFGKTMVEYRNSIKIDYVAELLSTTDLTLEAIAERAGYCDASAVSVAYRRFFGRSPSAARRFARCAAVDPASDRWPPAASREDAAGSAGRLPALPLLTSTRLSAAPEPCTVRRGRRIPSSPG